MMQVSQNDALAKVVIEDGLGVTVYVPFVGLVIEDGDMLGGALIFNGFDKQNVDMSVIALQPWTMRNLRDIAKYVFVRLGCKRVTCLTLTTNHRAINRLIQLGFECEGRARERFPQGDAFIFGLLASEQKFLRSPGGQHSQPSRSV